MRFFMLFSDVFRPSRQFGTFKSVILTFLVSSMLHGMNFNLTMVLLTLGFYTYVEFTLREKLASIFDACIRSRACSPTCQHTYKSSNLTVIVVNVLFGMWSYFHLAYLGIMMDKSHLEDGKAPEGFLNFLSSSLQRWDELGYASHWAMAIVFLGSIVIWVTNQTRIISKNAIQWPQATSNVTTRKCVSTARRRHICIFTNTWSDHSYLILD